MRIIWNREDQRSRPLESRPLIQIAMDDNPDKALLNLRIAKRISQQVIEYDRQRKPFLYGLRTDIIAIGGNLGTEFDLIAQDIGTLGKLRAILIQLDVVDEEFLIDCLDWDHQGIALVEK